MRKHFNIGYIEKTKDSHYRVWMHTPFKSGLDIVGKTRGYKNIKELRKDFQNIKFKKLKKVI